MPFLRDWMFQTPNIFLNTVAGGAHPWRRLILALLSTGAWGKMDGRPPLSGRIKSFHKRMQPKRVTSYRPLHSGRPTPMTSAIAADIVRRIEFTVV